MLHTVLVIIFVLQTLSWCQTNGKSREEFTVIELTAFQEAFREDFEYSDFFQDHPLQPQHIGDVRREFIYCGLESGLEKQLQSKSSTTSTTRASKNRGTKI